MAEIAEKHGQRTNLFDVWFPPWLNLQDALNWIHVTPDCELILTVPETYVHFSSIGVIDG